MANRNPDPSRALDASRRKLFFRRRISLLVWVGVLLVAVPLYIRQEAGLTVTGFAQETRYSIASERGGRLRRIEVGLNQEVSRGQIVASLADDEARLQLQEARAELDRLSNELGRARALGDFDAAGRQADQQVNLLRFAQDASAAHIGYLAALTDLAEDRITVQGLELNLGRTRHLQAGEMVSTAALEDDRIEFEALTERIVRQEAAVEAMLSTYRNAQGRYQEFLANHVVDAPDPELLLKPLESGLKIQETRIEMVSLAISKCVLRAPSPGRVAKIFHRSGEVVAAGQPVMSILDPLSAGIVAYLPEHRILDLEQDVEVRVRRVADPRLSFVSSIACLGSSVEPLPLRLDPLAETPGWGRAVFIPIPGSLTAVPGEAFEVSF